METLTTVRRKRAKPLPPVEIREMELKDVAEVFELGQKLFTAEEWPSLYRSWDDHELALLFSNDSETHRHAHARRPHPPVADSSLRETDAGGGPAARTRSHPRRRNPGAAPPLPARRPGKGAPVAARPGRRVQRQRGRPRGAPMGGNRRTARLYGSRPPGPRGGGRAPGTAGGRRPGARIAHQSAAGLHHAA